MAHLLLFHVLQGIFMVMPYAGRILIYHKRLGASGFTVCCLLRPPALSHRFWSLHGRFQQNETTLLGLNFSPFYECKPNDVLELSHVILNKPHHTNWSAHQGKLT
jgi:hypothetical protein